MPLLCRLIDSGWTINMGGEQRQRERERRTSIGKTNKKKTRNTSSGKEDLLSYESRYTTSSRRRRVLAVCTYIHAHISVTTHSFERGAVR